jgi:hypothetical protein
MDAPGKGMLKVVSILFIIFGAIATVAMLFASLIPILMSSAINMAADQLSEEAAAAASGMMAAVGPLLIIGLIIGIIAALAELIIGIMGVKKAADASQAGFFITTGIILCAIQLISIILTMAAGGAFPVTSLIGFVLPILYIVGGNQNKKVSAAPAA